MIEIIIGTRGQIMERAIVEAVDNFTKHTYENRFLVEGWKTNEGHLLNEKFIIGYISEKQFNGGLRIRCYGHYYDRLIDLNKALCYITGKSFDELPHIRDINNGEDLVANTWYDWGFFQFKVFKKGTGHFKFKDHKVWELLNRAYAKAKGQVLPENLKTAA